MNWENCVSESRTGNIKPTANVRTNFQRDYDRLIFSSAFRRLQNKTQVFPLPGNTFVHNRLTHSLEVACVGRSLGDIVGSKLLNHDLQDAKESVKLFYEYDLPAVIAAGCLAHDMGNPPFGHSGEKAISTFFKEHDGLSIDGQSLRDHFTEHEWSDLTNFEGNANALHILTHAYEGKLHGGQSLTYTTLASILKYPCSSTEVDKSFKHRKKYGFFKTDEVVYNEIVKQTNMHKDTTASGAYHRHPFVYLVEAADDICYRIIDMEDAHRIGIIATSDLVGVLTDIITDLQPTEIKKVNQRLSTLSDANEKISYLRAKCINFLVSHAATVFMDNRAEILAGTWNDTLIDVVEQQSKSLVEADNLSKAKIYNHNSVIEVEIAGYHVMSGLLKLFIPAALSSNPGTLGRKMLQLVPTQFGVKEASTAYDKAMAVVDFIAGMTDGYATELYRKASGIEIAKHR